jgi:hypothetical protein
VGGEVDVGLFLMLTAFALTHISSSCLSELFRRSKP